MSLLKTGVSAALLDFTATYFLVDFHNGTADVLAFLGVHFVACAMLAVAVMPAFPARYRKPYALVFALLFSFAFFVPLLGALGLFAAVIITTLMPRTIVHEPFAEVRAPEYVLSIRDPEMQFRPAGLRATLLDPSLPTELRMRSLIALQNMPTRVAAPTLRRLLGDSSEDIRLVAYGILDQKEKIINSQILEELAGLNGLADQERRVNALRHMAELNWELIYTGLVLGDVRAHTLRQVLDYTDQALALAGSDPGLWLLRARALHASQRLDEAMAGYSMAMSSGLTEARALPYLAEIAYDRKDTKALRGYMAKLAQQGQSTPMMAPVIRYWTAPPAAKVRTGARA